jgi:hypothetical protein
MTVELFGPARALAGRSTIVLDVAEPLGVRAFIDALADAVPAFVGEIVTRERDAFVAPNLLLLDGRRAADDAEPFGDADRPCVMFVPSGG